MSPCVATTRPSFTATMTPQPVPQKRQGAFAHWSWRSSPVRMFWASAGREIPAAAAAAAAAWAFRTVRRVRSMDLLPLVDRLEMMKDEGRGEHAVEELDCVDPFDDLAFRLRLEGDDQF